MTITEPGEVWYVEPLEVPITIEPEPAEDTEYVPDRDNG